MMTSDFSGEGGERGGGEGREGARSDPRSQSSSLTTEEILAALKGQSTSDHVFCSPTHFIKPHPRLHPQGTVHGHVDEDVHV